MLTKQILEHLAEIFPDPNEGAADAPLAYGGNFNIDTLLGAYYKGIFPWSGRQPITWWSPDPRCVLIPARFHISSRSARKIKNMNFTCTINHNFEDVIHMCAATRKFREGTWLSKKMISAYTELHKLGYAMSVETWLDDKLVGGLYGVCLGKAFFGESMFHLVTEASRAALVYLMYNLIKNGFVLIDCQQVTPHMLRMGAEAMPRRRFLSLLSIAFQDL